MRVNISIIVPIYNVDAYLTECLESIVAQKYKGRIEVILINDRSTDRSQSICLQFLANYPSLFVYHEQPENLGVSSARNAGLELSNGDYFCYVDADDVLPPSALETLHSAALQGNADIVKGNNLVFSTEKRVQANYGVKKNESYTGDELLTLLYGHNKIRGHSWGKLFRSATLKRYRFPEGIRMAEDLAYCVNVFSHAKSLMLIPDNVYYYRLRPSGAAKNKYKNYAYRDWFNVLLDIKRYAITKSQKKAYYSLVVRSMLEYIRECRSFSGTTLKQLLNEVTQLALNTNVNWVQLIFKHHVTLATLSRYIKYQRTYQVLRTKVAASATDSTL